MDALRAIRVSRLMMAFLKQLGPGCLAETPEAGRERPTAGTVDATTRVERERRKKVCAASSPCLSLRSSPPLTQHACTSHQLPSPIRQFNHHGHGWIHPVASTTCLHVTVVRLLALHMYKRLLRLFAAAPPAICACASHCHLSTQLNNNKQTCCNSTFFLNQTTRHPGGGM
jgi:hypothetical protein